MDNKVIPKYFAAANSYNGFICFFDKVFNSKDYDGIFVLKGGPGTGKSSMMKQAVADLNTEDARVEEIYCSSDPHSLDGVIIEKGERRIAFIDGTAPHERDAVIPGAIDQIVNLGNNWDSRWLVSQKDKILLLTSEKRRAYKSAYYHLSLAGMAAKETERQGAAAYLYKNAFLRAKSLAESIAKCGDGSVKIRLLSSFGRYGAYGFNTARDVSKTTYTIAGRETHRHLFMAQLRQALEQMCANITVAPSPLCPEHTDAILLEKEGVGITFSGGSEIIDASEFSTKMSAVDEEQIKLGEQIRMQALTEAERWFRIASDIHFRLEEIYTQAMDFSKNDEIYLECYDKAVNILNS